MLRKEQASRAAADRRLAEVWDELQKALVSRGGRRSTAPATRSTKLRNARQVPDTRERHQEKTIMETIAEALRLLKRLAEIQNDLRQPAVGRARAVPDPQPARAVPRRRTSHHIDGQRAAPSGRHAQRWRRREALLAGDSAQACEKHGMRDPRHNVDDSA
jgi:hypothetical protein